MGRIRLSSKKQYKPYPIELYLRCKHNSHNKAEETESMKDYKSTEKPSLFLLPRNASALRGNSLSLRSLRKLRSCAVRLQADREKFYLSCRDIRSDYGYDVSRHKRYGFYYG